MFTRISLIVAIVAALTVTGLNVVKIRHQITSLTADRGREKTLKEAAQRSLADTNLKLSRAANELKGTQEELGAIRIERDAAVARADAESQKATALAATLKTTQEERDQAANDLAALRTTAVSIEEFRTTLASLKKVTGERDTLTARNHHLKARLAKIDPLHGEGAELPKDLKGTIKVSDPKYGFVVLNVGEDQGVFEGAPLLVHRDGRLVAKVLIKSTEPTRSIANILPGWEVAEIKEGDQILVE